MIDQEERDVWERDENGCTPDCPIRILGEQSGERKTNGGYRNNKVNKESVFQTTQPFKTAGYDETGSAARYFAQFYPDSDSDDDETPQERGETQLPKSDEVQSGDLPIDQVIHGDALEVLRRLPPNCCHAIVTDPPYGMGTVKDIAGLLLAWIHDEDDSKHLGKSGFMGKEWDSGVPGPRYWREAYRVLKPGGHILAFSSTRTYDLLVIALRLAGFECRDQISWLFGSGFPKSMDVSKAIDRMAGEEREVVGKYQSPENTTGNSKGGMFGAAGLYEITAPATDLARKWDGWGSALKPSHEPICLARKPLAEKTIAAQVLATGTGAINVDASRIGLNGDDTSRKPVSAKGWKNSSTLNGTIDDNWQKGRFPSNTLFSHSPACVTLGEKRVRDTHGKAHDRHNSNKIYGNQAGACISTGYTDEEGMEAVQAYDCAPDCPVAELDRQSGVRKSGGRIAPRGTTRPGLRGNVVNRASDFHAEPSEGTAARYFKTFPPVEDMVPFTYQSKASRKDRSSNGVVNNTHPTCKPLSLMKYLCNMITPENGIVLDMFCGSGSTLCAAVYGNYHFIGIDQDASYIEIAKARVAHAQKEMLSGAAQSSYGKAGKGKSSSQVGSLPLWPQTHERGACDEQE